jgi:hypothetical protein
MSMSSVRLSLAFERKSGSETRAVQIDQLVIAGWTGRNKAAMEAHIEELEKLGVARPKSTPIYYRAAAQMLTTADRIEVAGGDSSGEVEFMLFGMEDGLWIGVGSDHTDRKLETIGVTWSKQACPHPLASTLWRFDEVVDHWEQLILRSFAIEDGKPVLYQEGPVTAMLPPLDLIANCPVASGKTLPAGTAMYCGTLPAKGGIRPAEGFTFELEDPVLKRKIGHSYMTKVLPIEG